MKKLIVASISPVAEDRNQRKYKTITLKQGPVYDEEGEPVISMNARQMTYQSYEERYLDNQVDPLFNVAVGQKVAGDIVQVDTKPFIIDEKKKGVATGNKVTLTKDTFLVFGDSSNADSFNAQVETTRLNRIAQREKATLSVATAATPTLP